VLGLAETLAKKVLTSFEVLSAAAETMSESDLGKRFILDSPYTEFCRLTQAFNSVMDRFQRNGEIQRSFCDIAAYEMKTPLTILQGNLDVALMKARTSEEYREALINNLETDHCPDAVPVDPREFHERQASRSPCATRPGTHDSRSGG
jgi:hypothetical protein